MSTPHLGEFFAALLSCAIERCERGDPASLRQEIGHLAYLTFGYSDRVWLDHAIFEADLDDESQSALLAQLDRELSQSAPAWLDRIQLRALILGLIRLVRAPWATRDDLTREVCHVFSLSTKQLTTTDLSNVATLAPHLWVMLHARSMRKNKGPQISPHWAPLPKEYSALRVDKYEERYWSIKSRRGGLTSYVELMRCDDESYAERLVRSLSEEVNGWLPIVKKGREAEWVWIERPAHLDLSLITTAEQRMSSEQAVLVCLPILRALSALHRTQRVCGILTPERILIDPQCQSMLGDRLRWYPYSAQLQRSDWRLEELKYWSPERLEAETEPTPQSDMWAFGLILYQLLCGDLPWSHSKNVVNALEKIQSVNLEALLDRAPSSVRPFLARCLTRQLDQRWSHATQALEALSEIAESTSPLLQGQRLSEQWTILMEVDGAQRFIEETAIIPTFEPEEDLARFIQVRADLDDLASPHIDPLSLKPLFPHLKTLHERWWTNHAASQDALTQQENSLEAFRVSLTHIAPEFLFEQLTLLSKQKEALELRFQERHKRLLLERETLRREIREHTLDTLNRLWNRLGLPEDLIPNLSLEAAALRGAKRTQLANAPRSAPRAQDYEGISEAELRTHEVDQELGRLSPSALFEAQAQAQGHKTEAEFALNEQVILAEMDESENDKARGDEPASSAQSESVLIALGSSEEAGSSAVLETSPSEEGSATGGASTEEAPQKLRQVHNSSWAPGQLLHPEQLELAEATLRHEILSTPPEQRLERLEELSALKREIELSQPMIAAQPPLPEADQDEHWSAPPLVFSLPPLEVTAEGPPPSEDPSSPPPLSFTPTHELSLTPETSSVDSLPLVSADLLEELSDENEEDIEDELFFGEPEPIELTLPRPKELHQSSPRGSNDPLDEQIEIDQSKLDDLNDFDVSTLFDEFENSLNALRPPENSSGWEPLEPETLLSTRSEISEIEEMVAELSTQIVSDLQTSPELPPRDEEDARIFEDLLSLQISNDESIRPRSESDPPSEVIAVSPPIDAYETIDSAMTQPDIMELIAMAESFNDHDLERVNSVAQTYESSEKAEHDLSESAEDNTSSGSEDVEDDQRNSGGTP